MKNKNIGVSFIPTELSIDEIIDSDIYFGKKLLKEIIKVVRLNRGTINIEIMEIIQLLQAPPLTKNTAKKLLINIIIIRKCTDPSIQITM
jgi:hypothetical protein